MMATIPEWAYHAPQSGWVRYGRFDQKGNEEWLGGVPAWACPTSGLAGGDQQHLVIRVRPEVEVVISGSLTDDLDAVDRALSQRTCVQRWPVRTWWLSHLVWLTHVVKVPKEDGRTTSRFCAGRFPDSRKKFQQLAFLALPPLPLTINTAPKSAHDWDIQLQVSNQPQHLPHHYHFVASLATLRAWEREMVFIALAPLMPASLRECCEAACSRLVKRIQHIIPSKRKTEMEGGDAFTVKIDSVALAGIANPVDRYQYPLDQTPVTAERRLFDLIQTGMLRLPMPVVFPVDKDAITGDEATDHLTFFPPAAFDDRGRCMIPRAATSRVVFDLTHKKRTLLTRMVMIAMRDAPHTTPTT